jgi:OOP family OmpA-OmpF porin
VDANGCPILDRSQERQELLVEFDFDQAVVKPEFYDEIATFAEFLMTYSNTNAVIEGHTDSDGTEAYNQGLSERRANAVMNRLVSEHGIAASRLSAVGYGESRPVVENNNAANKQRNRRIEAEVSVQVETQRQR